jgi:hypothetical protein
VTSSYENTTFQTRHATSATSPTANMLMPTCWRVRPTRRALDSWFSGSFFDPDTFSVISIYLEAQVKIAPTANYNPIGRHIFIRI